MNWASALTVNFGGNIYDDWRLPEWDGCQGYCTGSELGHLYYTELGNTGGDLINTGDFQKLYATTYYFSSIDFMGDPIRFYFKSGLQVHTDWDDHGFSAITLRNGDVSIAVVPEPISYILFITGGALLTGRRLLKRRRS